MRGHCTDGVYNSMPYDAYLLPKSHVRRGIAHYYTYNALDQRALKISDLYRWSTALIVFIAHDVCS